MVSVSRVKDLVNSKYQILILVVSVAAIKLVTASWILERLLTEGHSSGQVFVDWDSAFFLTLAQNGYPAPDANKHHDETRKCEYNDRKQETTPRTHNSCSVLELP